MTWAQVLFQTQTQILSHVKPIWYKNEQSNKYEGPAPFVTGLVLISATLKNPVYQSYTVTNCARVYMEPPPPQWFASVQTPNVITSCAAACDLLKVTGVTLIEKLMSDEFKMTEYTHLLTLEDPLELNLDLTKVHE